MTWRWPVALRQELPSGERLTLRPLVRKDRAEFEAVLGANAGWLRPWESTTPGTAAHGTPAVPVRPPFHRMRRSADRAARDGLHLPLVIDINDRIVGQVQLFDVLWGARRTGWAGYWLAREETGRGYATWALATLVDHALLDVGLHRIEVAIRPENTASLAVVARLSLREEGLQRGLMHVDGGWRDHRSFVVLAEELGPGGLLGRLAHSEQDGAEQGGGQGDGQGDGGGSSTGPT
ncbi:GNAT family N-acetyltransferase [Ornithinimicrobium pratense]|uniref:GNAT family N-acetyltransferase n=1 Tax=Ornithinimicrobium pratense TaxID=2593973 RepID=A0A5J6V1N7_9MICO|nr:GNAT family protein [Ornithinimicrobium pratense]QFG67709.1 GNAT family N-acetyltransferase [Ornithinimicrobium pratense]